MKALNPQFNFDLPVITATVFGQCEDEFQIVMVGLDNNQVDLIEATILTPLFVEPSNLHGDISQALETWGINNYRLETIKTR